MKHKRNKNSLTSVNVKTEFGELIDVSSWTK